MSAVYAFLAKHKKFLLFAAVLFYLYFRGIGDHGLLDPLEGVNASVSLHMLASGHYFVPRIGESAVAGRSMGSWWLSALALKIFGWWEFSVRFWPALAGIGMALAAAMASRRRPLLAAAVAASMTLGFAASQLSSSHALYACCVGFAMTAFLRVSEIMNDDVSDSEWYGQWKWLLLAHIMPIMALIIHGPEGIILPWAALLAFSILVQRFSTLGECWAFWPGALISVFGTAGYFALLWLKNPVLLDFMRSEAPKLIETDWRLTLLLLLAGTTPWQGFIAAAVKGTAANSMADLRDGFSPSPSDTRKLFMIAWAVVFALAAIITGDILALSACVPAVSALVAASLSEWLDAGNTESLRAASSASALFLVPLVFVGIPLSIASFPALRDAMMSLIPWGVFVLVFLIVVRRCARGGKNALSTARQYGLSRGTAAVALLCLMPLAGAFDLASDKMSLHEVGPALHKEVHENDVVAQYAINRPSLYFYTLHSSALVNGELLPGVASKNLLMDDTALHLLWTGADRVFLLMTPERRPASPLPLDVYSVIDANGMSVVSNR